MIATIVYKYALPAMVAEIDVPANGTIRLVGSDPASGLPALWIEHDASGFTERRTFLVVGTGQPIESGASFVGSVIAGQFVWHVYERT